MLQAAPLRHQAQGASQQPALYRIKDEINVEVDIQELRGGRWQPYRWVGGEMLASVCTDYGGDGQGSPGYIPGAEVEQASCVGSRREGGLGWGGGGGGTSFTFTAIL